METALIQISDLFPDNLIYETKRTHALLFPLRDTETKKLLEDHLCLPGVDLRNALCEWETPITERRLGDFHFWRERLILLKETFDDAQPTTLRGMWRDRRNANQWWTSWIAIIAVSLTLFFGLVQSIEGAIQVYKAYHPTPS